MTLTQTQDRIRAIYIRKIERGTMSNKLLSALTHIAPAHVCNWRHARRRLSIEALSQVTHALGLELEILPIQATTFPQDAPIRKTTTPSTPKTPSTAWPRHPISPAPKPPTTPTPHPRPGGSDTA